MRIISGNSKGKRLLEPKNKSTRPLKDLTKESIFNIIQHSNKFKVEVDNSNILDLFSGVGSFGLECLSRNASSVTFIENYKEALLVLKKNIEDLNYSNSTLVIEKNIFSQFKFESLKKKYDIIFLDPPYKEKNMNSLIVSIDASKILNNNGILIVHRHKKEKDEFPKNFNILEKKNYGISKIIFGNFT